jgi:hypothetical protein
MGRQGAYRDAPPDVLFARRRLGLERKTICERKETVSRVCKQDGRITANCLSFGCSEMRSHSSLRLLQLAQTGKVRSHLTVRTRERWVSESHT